MQRSLIGFVFVFALALALIPYRAAHDSSIATATTHAPLLPDAGESVATDHEPVAVVATVVKTVSTPPMSVAPAPAPTPAQAATPAPAPAPQPAPATPDYPTNLRIPSIGFNDPIIKVGTNSKGEMDVPDGKTKNVGWYAGGTMPGNVGSAVIGAHVYAAFANLHKVQVGDSVYVTSRDGKQLHFVVTDTKVYELSTMSAEALFNRQGGKYLHLITCAGSVTPDGSTYTHRRVVYATLVE